jgi:dynein regulatory complex subunit 2
MRLEDEMQRAMTSSKLIEDFWREQLRKLKSIELKKRIEVLSQQHDRQVDRKDAMIQMLFRDMEESEEQYRLALRTHLLNVDRLIHIQEERMEIIQEEFERGLTEIQEEFEEEK